MRAPLAGLRVEYLPLHAPELGYPQNVLGVAVFAGSDSASPFAGDIPWIPIRLPVLGAHPAVCEVWRAGLPMRAGVRGSLHYRHNEQLLFGCIRMAEPLSQEGARAGLPRTAETAGAVSDTSFFATTERVYREIFAAVQELGFPHLVRVWNYLAAINVVSQGLERYRQFNSARRAALRASGQTTSGNVPAACALGSPDDSPLAVYFLASRAEPAVIENPRQISAYEYPAQYGPKPAFSRASALRSEAATLLFISGTASIVGHETRHVGDVAAQTRETLINIESLLEEANRLCTGATFDIRTLAYKVYVRNAEDQPAVQAQLAAVLGPDAKLLFLQADVCRQELLVEIEAVGCSTG
ncbi:MAG: hypothetical protein JOY91_03970 [Sinobacteraceae bacterium]|nr:hypothetical protein [Nevskiaceae bacterium]